MTQEALEKVPHNPALIAFDAWILFHLPNTDPETMLQTCASRLAIALTLNDSLAEGHKYLGRVRESQMLHDEAIVSYRRALKLDPTMSRFKSAERVLHLAGRF